MNDTARAAAVAPGKAGPIRRSGTLFAGWSSLSVLSSVVLLVGEGEEEARKWAMVGTGAAAVASVACKCETQGGRRQACQDQGRRAVNE